MAAPKLYDVLIIGGGPAGLSMALALARQAYSALVLDSGEYRNARAEHVHTIPGFDHADPEAFRAKVREDLRRRYASIEFQSATVSRVRKVDGDGTFEAVDDDGGVYRGRKLGLGTGVRDVFPEDIPGYEECWGRGIFHCLFCHGFEERGAASVGALAGGLVTTPEMLAHATLMAKGLARSVTVYTNGNPALLAAVKPRLQGRDISYDDRRIARVALEGETGPGVVLHFADGTSKAEGFVTNHPRVEPRAPFAAQLGLDTTPGGDVVTTAPFNETSVRGCFAAGDAATVMRSAVKAIEMGSFAGAGLVAQMNAELDERGEL